MYIIVTAKLAICAELRSPMLMALAVLETLSCCDLVKHKICHAAAVVTSSG